MKPILLELHCSKLQRLVAESLSTVNFLKVGAPKIITDCHRFGPIWFIGPIVIMYPKDAAGMANSADPDQTAPLRAV